MTLYWQNLNTSGLCASKTHHAWRPGAAAWRSHTAGYTGWFGCPLPEAGSSPGPRCHCWRRRAMASCQYRPPGCSPAGGLPAHTRHIKVPSKYKDQSRLHKISNKIKAEPHIFSHRLSTVRNNSGFIHIGIHRYIDVWLILSNTHLSEQEVDYVVFH